MDDLISRQAAIDALNKMKIYRPLDSDRYVISDCLNKIVNLPSAQPEDICSECDAWNVYKNYAQPKWIPVTERLPEDQTYVLVSTLDNDVQEAHLDGEGRFRDCYGDKVKCVIAWMPLPEPYKGDQ